MNYKNLIFALFLSVATINLAHAATETECKGKSLDNCPAGCKYNSGSCSQCDAGKYSDTDKSTSCKDCHNDYPNSYEGASALEQCYKECTDTQIPNGYLHPKTRTVTYNNSCNYTDKSNITCDNGYHKSKTCTSTTCTCIENKQSCSGNEVGLTGAGGNAIWNGSDYNKSECFKTGIEYKGTYGTGTQKCFYTSGAGTTAEFTTGCDEYSMSTCDAGYYYNANQNSQDCIQVTAGWYSGKDTINRTACFRGTTSDADSDEIADCYMKGGTATACSAPDGNCTKFCDNNGCFYLPVDKVEYKAH